MDGLPFVSVIIPVYRQRNLLAGCLEALSGQTYPASRFEVLIVDNDAGAAPEPEAGAAPGRPSVRWISEPRRGSYAARNRGVREANGELLAFTDADCRPEKGWLDIAVRRWLALGARAIVGGDIRLKFRAAKPTACERFDAMFLGFPQRRFVEEEHFAATANMICDRQGFAAAGPFDEAFMSSGDYEWGRRAHSAGVSLHFEPSAVVEHPARHSVAALVVKLRRHAGGNWLLRRRQGRGGLLRAVQDELRRLGAMRRAVSAAGLSFGDSLRLQALCVFLQSVRMAETCRVAAGGAPTRR